MVLGVPDTVLTQTVGLVGGLAFDPRPGRLDAGEVRVDVGNTDGQPALGHRSVTR